VFTVRHRRDTKHGSYDITDERDIYEHVANMAARRLRACILGVIPGDVQDLAVAACHKTLIGESSEPIIDRARKMVTAFSDLGVSQVMIETRLNHPVASISPNQLAQLGRIFNSIKDGVATREDHFDLNAGQTKPTTLDELTDRLEDAQAAPSDSSDEPAPADNETGADAMETPTDDSTATEGQGEGEGATDPIEGARKAFAACQTVSACGRVYTTYSGMCTTDEQRDAIHEMSLQRQGDIGRAKSESTKAE
jgi:hypothetical protein